MAKKNSKKDFMRVVVASDMHCGHRAGLTPPEHFQYNTSYLQQQKKTWEFWSNSLKELRDEHPIDLLIHNGDAIDGKGERSGGTELYEVDRSKQVEIAYSCLKESQASEYALTYGTPYHVGQEEDFERLLSWKLNCDIEGHMQRDVNGVLFDVKHKVGSSPLPHSRYTSIAKEKLLNTMWNDRGGQINADVIIRSHVHYFAYCGDGRFLGVVTPALQGFGSKYGVRQCSGTVDFGLIWFDIYGKDDWSWGRKIMQYEVVKKGNKYESRLK